nr:MAG: hypothetical protein [Chemarfal virus 204]
MEYNDFIGMNTGAADYKFLSTLSPYRNLTNMIQASKAWQQNVPNFAYFKLNGMSIRCARVCAEGTQTVPDIGIPPLYIAYFPTGFSSANGSATVMAMDNNVRVDGYITGVQSKYYAFTSDMNQGGTSIRTGEWSNVNDINSLYGELDLGTPNVVFATGNHITFEIRVTIYAQFCDSYY